MGVVAFAVDDDPEAKPLVYRVASAAAREPSASAAAATGSPTAAGLLGSGGGGGAIGARSSSGGGGLCGLSGVDGVSLAGGAPAMPSPVEAAVVRKLHRRVLSLLFAVAMMCYIDRTNLAFASVSMTADLGFNAQVYGLGSGLFFLGYSASMVPAQLALLRVGAPRALSAIVTLWGAAAAAFCLLSGAREFYLLRLLLGAFESGAFPAIWFVLNSWYPPAHATVAYSVIEAAVGAANCVAAPMAAALLSLDGTFGLRGWQILFFVEGLPSVLLGLVIGSSLPRHVHDARWLTPPERAWLAAASAPARRHAEAAEALPARRLLREALGNARLWGIIGVGVLKNAALTGVLFFAPKLVDAILSGAAVEHVVHTASISSSIGSSSSSSSTSSTGQAATAGAAAGRRALLAVSGAAPTSAGVRAALLTAVPFVLAAAAALWLGRRVQRHGDRCRHLAVPWLISAACFIAFPAAASSSPEAGFAALTAAVVTATAPNALLNMLASAVSAGPSQAVALSVYNAVANLGGLAGPLFIGAVVHRTGVYTAAMQGLGALVALAAVLVWQMRHLDPPPPSAAVAGVGAVAAAASIKA